MMCKESIPHQFSYEKLAVWQDARVLIRDVYAQTRGFPKSEAFGLTSQLNRAVVSVACNLAKAALAPVPMTRLTSPKSPSHP